MKLFIGYATNEGQTRKIAQHVADRCFDKGHSVEIMALDSAGTLDLTRFDGVILGGSVHVGHYQSALSEFAASHARALSSCPNLLLSISLAAAGHDAEDWRGLDTILADFQHATGWTPDHVAQVAGAYMPQSYDIFRRFVMRRIIAAKDPGADLDCPSEYTDWVALNAVVDEWLEHADKS